MKHKKDPDKETQTLQQLQREKIKIIEYLYDWLESGKSLEEIEIMIDIPAAAGRIPEYSHKICREALDLIKMAQWAGLNRTEVLAYLREREKADTTYE
jgi:hypothetical protein